MKIRLQGWYIEFPFGQQSGCEAGDTIQSGEFYGAKEAWEDPNIRIARDESKSECIFVRI